MALSDIWFIFSFNLTFEFHVWPIRSCNKNKKKKKPKQKIEIKQRPTNGQKNDQWWEMAIVHVAPRNEYDEYIFVIIIFLCLNGCYLLLLLLLLKYYKNKNKKQKQRKAWSGNKHQEVIPNLENIFNCHKSCYEYRTEL